MVVDLDGTLLKVDTLYELFVSGLFTAPARTLLSLLALRDGVAAFKGHLSKIVRLDAGALPVRDDLYEYLMEERAAGREIHLATAADQRIAAQSCRTISDFPNSSRHRSKYESQRAQQGRATEQAVP